MTLPKLPVRQVMVDMIAEPWAMRRGLFSVLSLPAALMMAAIMLAYTLDETPSNAWWVWGFYALAGAYFAVRCHRLLLLGAVVGGEGGHRLWGWRETRFLVALLVVYLCSFLVTLVVTVPISMVLGLLFPEKQIPPDWLLYLAYLPQTWMLGRLSLVLPAIAVDQRLSLGGAWALSRGNGWRLMWLVGLVPIALSGLPDLLLRAGATVVEQVALTLLTIPLLIIEVAALSFSYRELASPPDATRVAA